MATLSTIEKAGRVLDLFGTHASEWGVSEVAARLQVPRSSAHALLSSLADIGILQWREGGRYRIGWRVIELAEVRRRMLDVRAAAEPVLRGLVGTYGETCHLAVRDRHAVLYIDKVLGTHNITVQGAAVGTRLESHCTAVGKTLLAFADQGTLTAYLVTAPFPRHTSTTITTAEQFTHALEEIRRRGVGFDLGEAVDDVYCVAAPIRDEFGQVIAAVSLSAPDSRFHKHRATYTSAVKAAAMEIGRAVVDGSMADPVESLDYPRVAGP